MKGKIVLLTNLVLIAMLATIGASAQGTNLVANGSFEDPIVTDPNAWDIYPSGTPGLGWSVEWTPADDNFPGLPAVANAELQRQPGEWVSYDGQQHTELDSDWDGPEGTIVNEQANVRIYQDLPTCPGGVYELQYAWSPRPLWANNAMEVWWGDDVVAKHVASGANNTNAVWTLETLELTAPGDLTRLAFVEVGYPDAEGMLLDGVSVVEIGCGVNVQVHAEPACCDDPDGTTEVVIMGSANLDVEQIDVSTLNFGGSKAPQCTIEEVSGDAYPDLVCQFGSSFTLTGSLKDGAPIEGSAKVCCP